MPEHGTGATSRDETARLRFNLAQGRRRDDAV